VLVGSPMLYELAYGLDEDVRKLFRVKAELWLSTRFVEIAGLAAEASHWAAQDESELVRS
jgi:hypothetical protein